MRRVLVAASISVSSESSFSESTRDFNTESRSRAVVTRRTVRAKASRTIGTPSSIACSDASADGIDIAAYFQHPRNTAFDQGINRPFVFKQRSLVCKLGPPISHLEGGIPRMLEVRR